jgi:hypothetical protein
MEKKEDSIFSIGCRQTGLIIDKFATLEDAKNALNEFEKQDLDDGFYEADFYEIRCLGEVID